MTPPTPESARLVAPELEAMCRAMCRSYTSDGVCRGDNLDQLVNDNWRNWLPEARAGLQAIRIMSPEMIAAYVNAGLNGGRSALTLGWTGVIDHILSENQSPREGRG